MLQFSEAPLTEAEIDYLCAGIASRPVADMDGVRVDVAEIVISMMKMGKGRALLRRKIFENDVRTYFDLPDEVDPADLIQVVKEDRRLDYLRRTRGRGWPGLPEQLRSVPPSWPWPRPRSAPTPDR